MIKNGTKFQKNQLYKIFYLSGDIVKKAKGKVVKETDIFIFVEYEVDKIVKQRVINKFSITNFIPIEKK